jgi:hypothetical protein
MMSRAFNVRLARRRHEPGLAGEHHQVGPVARAELGLLDALEISMAIRSSSGTQSHSFDKTKAPH